MTDRLHVPQPLYPMVSIAAVLLTIIGSLLLAKTIWGSVFVVCVYLLLFCFGYAKTCIRMLPFLIIYLGVFSLIFYFASSGNTVFTWQMANRLGGIAVGIIPGMSMPPIRLTRCLTSLKCPRLLTLGILITLSFIPVLTAEIRQVRSAMRTRGVTNIWNPTAFYRAFLIPLLVRLVNISDTLALSVETRGFVSDDTGYTVYHPVNIDKRDIAFSAIFLLLFTAGIVLGPILGVSL